MNHVKKSLVSVFFVLSFLSLKSQTFDLTNQRTCSVEDYSVINSDTLLLDVTKNIFKIFVIDCEFFDKSEKNSRLEVSLCSL